MGFKVSEEAHEHIRQLIEASGDQPGEWFKKAVSLVELQSIKQGASEYTQDLNELEIHTTRIYELISNMVQRSIYIKDDAVKEVSTKLEQREIHVNELNEKIKLANDSANSANEYAAEIEKANDTLLKQLNDLRNTNESNALLIHEYKTKIDDLSGIISEYKGYKEENDKLKKEHAAEINQHKNQKEKLVNEIVEHQDEIKTLKSEITRTIEMKDIELQKSLLESERAFQNKAASANEEYNNTLKELYKEINDLRQSLSDNRTTYEQRIQTIIEESEKSKEV